MITLSTLSGPIASGPGLLLHDALARSHQHLH